MAKKKKETQTETSIDHGRLVDWIAEFDDQTINSREQAEKCRNYYDGRQWTESEARALEKRKQAATVINRIKPKMDGLMGMERANRTTAKSYPRTPKHEQAADAATEAIRFVLDDNAYPQKRSSAWDNMLVEGTGGLEVVVKTKGDLKITINQIPWDRLIYDPHSRRKDFVDGRFLGQFKWLDYDLALDEFPDGKDVLESMFQGSQTFDDKPRWLDAKRKRVRIIELYFRKEGDIHYACFTGGGYLKTQQISPYKNEEGETEWPYEFASLFISLDGDRYGHAMQYLDVQDEINKRRSKALHLMSVRQVAFMKGAVEDPNELRKQLALPDGAIELTQPIKDTFEVLQTGDMAQAQFNLLAEAKLEIDAVGYNAAASGKDMRAMSGVALENRKVASQTELAPMFDVLKHMDIRVYRKVWNRIKQYWKDEKWLRVTDDQASLRWVGLNAPITKGEMALQQMMEQGVPPEQIQMAKQQIAMDPMMKEVVDTRNDIAELDVDIVLADAPDTVTMQVEEFQMLGEMVKSGVPIPPTAIIEASNLKDKHKILKEMRAGVQIPKEVQEQMEKMKEEMLALKEENQQMKADQQTDMAKIQQQSQAKQAELQLQSQVQSEEIRLQREKAQAEIELKKAVAEADLQIEGAKMQMEHEHKQKEFAMEGEQMEKEHSREREKMAFEQKAKMAEKMPDADFQKYYDAEIQQTEAMPKIMEGLSQAFAQMQQALEQIASLQGENLKVSQATLQAIEKTKSVSISGVRKDEFGQITGASISTRLQ